MTTLAVGAIGVYRRYLSPWKGFRCAHAALHGRGSCSDFGLRVYERHPFATATALMRRRFAACRRAYLTLVAGSRSEDEEKERRRTWQDAADWTCTGIDVCDCLGGLPV